MKRDHRNLFVKFIEFVIQRFHLVINCSYSTSKGLRPSIGGFRDFFRSGSSTPCISAHFFGIFGALGACDPPTSSANAFDGLASTLTLGWVFGVSGMTVRCLLFCALSRLARVRHARMGVRLMNAPASPVAVGVLMR